MIRRSSFQAERSINVLREQHRSPQSFGCRSRVSCMEKELWQLSGSDLGNGYSTGTFTPVDVFESVLSRIQKVNPSINAFVTIDEPGARRSAEESAKRWQT